MEFKKLYEQYHSEIKIQKRIVTPKDFTYRHIISLLNKYLKQNQKILDIGCGAGTVDFFLASKGHRVLGIDISENALRTARINAKRFKLEKKARFKLLNFPQEFPAGKYDFIICSEVMEHLPNDKKAVATITKLLKKEGLIFITTPSSASILEKLHLMKKYNKRVGHLRTYSEKKWRGLIQKQGLRVLEIKQNEGIFRKLLYVLKLGRYPVKIANKYPLISDMLTFLDNITLKIFGETHIFVVAQKL